MSGQRFAPDAGQRVRGGRVVGSGLVTDVVIRPITGDDDMDAQLDLGERAFGLVSAGARAGWSSLAGLRAGQGLFLGAFAGGVPAGAAMIHDMRQWWLGTAVPCAGIASVKVAPEYRGGGIGRRLMTALLDTVAERGYPLSALYPATMPLYRSLGWELAGLRETAVIPARSLRDPAPPDPVIQAADPDVTAGSARLRRAAPGDAEAVIAVIGRVHQGARDCGPITWDAASVARSLADPDLYSYLCEDGVLSYRWHSGNHDALLDERAIEIDRLADHREPAKPDCHIVGNVGDRGVKARIDFRFGHFLHPLPLPGESRGLLFSVSGSGPVGPGFRREAVWC